LFLFLGKRRGTKEREFRLNHFFPTLSYFLMLTCILKRTERPEKKYNKKIEFIIRKSRQTVLLWNSFVEVYWPIVWDHRYRNLKRFLLDMSNSISFSQSFFFQTNLYFYQSLTLIFQLRRLKMCFNGEPSIFLLPIFWHKNHKWRERACSPFVIKWRHLI